MRRQADADAEFVAHAREDVLRLLALLERGSDEDASLREEG